MTVGQFPFNREKQRFPRHEPGAIFSQALSVLTSSEGHHLLISKLRKLPCVDFVMEQAWLSMGAIFAFLSFLQGLTQQKNASVLTCSLGEHERVQDVFEGAKIWWEFSSTERKNSVTIAWRAIPDMRRSLHMQIQRKDREKVLSGYLPHLLENAKALKLKRRERLLYTNVKRSSGDWFGSHKLWDSVPFKHPATFHSLALDPGLKKRIMDDLTDFANGEQFYKDVGRAWKRGYLLYGPPGTGKSSMIAAMANLPEYDVYDLELTEVKSNAVLRSLLLSTSDKAIIVIEDIDCSLDLRCLIEKLRESKVEKQEAEQNKEGENEGIEEEEKKEVAAKSDLESAVEEEDVKAVNDAGLEEEKREAIQAPAEEETSGEIGGRQGI